VHAGAIPCCGRRTIERRQGGRGVGVFDLIWLAGSNIAKALAAPCQAMTQSINMKSGSHKGSVRQASQAYAIGIAEHSGTVDYSHKGGGQRHAHAHMARDSQLGD
jgi:hypothetical protein